jgi:hypothetical protein
VCCGRWLATKAHNAHIRVANACPLRLFMRVLAPPQQIPAAGMSAASARPRPCRDCRAGATRPVAMERQGRLDVVRPRFRGCRDRQSRACGRLRTIPASPAPGGGSPQKTHGRNGIPRHTGFEAPSPGRRGCEQAGLVVFDRGEQVIGLLDLNEVSAGVLRHVQRVRRHQCAGDIHPIECTSPSPASPPLPPGAPPGVTSPMSVRTASVEEP